MQHKVSYDEKNELVRIDVIGGIDEGDPEEMNQKFLKNVEGKPYKQLLIDLRESDPTGGHNERRKELYDAVADAGFEDVALFGTTSATRLVVKVIIKLGTMGKRKMNIEFFKTEEEAVNWLKEQRK
ncbi:MAG: STAS/SEC14 domain-containing protein [Candidatus Aminicenantes bacterium]|nr:STAS/SEC14 domain-containing protein [Candidatus Aminicenantes bacterium]